MTQHGVKFMQVFGFLPDFVGRDPDLLGKFSRIFFGFRQELMQRWIDQTNGHRLPFHFLEETFEVFFLEHKQLVECHATCFHVIGARFW